MKVSDEGVQVTHAQCQGVSFYVLYINERRKRRSDEDDESSSSSSLSLYGSNFLFTIGSFLLTVEYFCLRL